MYRFLNWVSCTALVLGMLHGACSMETGRFTRQGLGETLEDDTSGLLLSSITPALGPTSGQTPLVLEGRNFADDATVSIAGVLATDVHVHSATRITATLPAQLGAFGNVPVTVQNRNGQTTVRSDLFAYHASQLDFTGRPNELPAGYTIAAADFNRDGHLDLLANEPLSVMLGNGRGEFSSPIGVPIRFPTHNENVIADLNGDGALDITVLNTPDLSLDVLLGDGKGHFSSPVSYAIGTTFRVLRAADFNGDEKLDLALLSDAASRHLSVVLGDGMGGFGAPTPIGVFTNPMAMVTGDWNGDQKADIVVGNGKGNDIYVFLGNGVGGFSAPTRLDAGVPADGMVAGDWNGDQKLDLAITSISTANMGVAVMLGDGMGRFGTPSYYPSAGAGPYMRVGDWDGDRVLDLAMQNGGLIRVLRGDGSGGFVLTSSIPMGGGFMGRLLAGDFTGDRNTDLLFSVNSTSNARGYRLSILTGNGLGRFAPMQDFFDVGTNPVAVVLGDWNGDERLDVAAANRGSNNLSVLLSDGHGGFGPATNFPANGAAAMESGDFDGDRRSDLAITNTVDASVSILFGDGKGGFRRLSNFVLPTAPSALVVGDFDGDRSLDIVVTLPARGAVGVLVGNGAGELRLAGTVSLGFTPAGVLRAGDFNGDTKLDLVISGPGLGGASVALGDGKGGFSVPAAVGIGVQGITTAVGDFNRDGKLDLVTSGTLFSMTGPLRVLQVMLGVGNGLFETGSTLFPLLGTSESMLAVADVDGDRKLDLIGVSSRDTYNQSVRIYLGDGAGGFGAPRDFLGGVLPTSIAVGDCTGDGKLDLVVASSGSGSVALVTNLSR